MNLFEINIIGLSNKVHVFEYDLDDRFFGQYGREIVEQGRLKARIVLNKHETFIEADFDLTGTIHLVCDRSLEPFDHPLHIHRKVMFKYGEEAREDTDEIVIITRDQVSLEVGQLMYEFIALSVPLKRLHPRFNEAEEEEDLSEGKLVYSSAGAEEQAKEQTMDPRWNELLKLKKNQN